MKIRRLKSCQGRGRFLVFSLLMVLALSVSAGKFVVADSATRAPLSAASVFNRNGQLLGVTNARGVTPFIGISEYPLTVRYLGFKEREVAGNDTDTVFLEKSMTELPEVVVESKKNNRLHILAYMREYSTLTSYTDTVTMFREKMVDFMLPVDDEKRSSVWLNPRVLSVKSYYQFTDSDGLDSVSAHCSHHYSWSDWVGIIPDIRMPSKIADGTLTADTVRGKYSPTEIWTRDNDRVMIDVDVLADTCSRRWTPNISHFFNREDADFDYFKLRFNYDNVIGKELNPIDLNSYSFNIESRGRGRRMFMFNRQGQPFYVTTYTEVYILDKEYISAKEAKKWERRKLQPEDNVILVPSWAPKLSPSTLALIGRVERIDPDKVRLDSKPDEKLLSPYYGKEYFCIDREAVKLVKKLGRVIFGL